MIRFVGAGCGAEDLITVRGQRLLSEADVIIYAGSLVNPKLLDVKKESAVVYNSAEMTLEEKRAFVDSLPEGLDYEAAIKGANLSGGQKQRLLVARALAADPEILILDDSSSALDYRTDAEMRRAIRAHHPDTTLILIAQRVSSVMQLDKILVMDDGRIIGCGSHAELMDCCPAYREICELQMGELG